MTVKKKNNNIFLSIILVICIVAVIIVGYIFFIKPKALSSNISTYTPTEKEAQETQPKKPTEPIGPTDLKENTGAKLPNEFIPKENRQIAPDFTLPDLDNNIVSLSDFRGNFVLLDFTTTWCTWCETQKPAILELMDMNKEDFVVLAIDVRESTQEIKNHYPNGPEYELLLDQSGDVASMYGLSGYPYYLLISPIGEVIYYQSGFKQNMRENVNAVLKEVRND
ncbi:MAG: TlpA family protein disulfide reductase [Caldisericia bacterium]|nr:TlpA family protein disulfide reductase [Caldisericia bacterium]